ncbi:MAG: T9SS type A sorting domain-containing protein, partial [Rhodothermales bacterium]|nr:T9SS type A sorting domain-containing protein [Rhodothermales bacterium]
AVGRVISGEQSFAAVWTPEEGTRPIKEFLEEDYDMDLGATVLGPPLVISDDGRVLAGMYATSSAAELFRVLLPPACNSWLMPQSGSFETVENWIYNSVPDIGECVEFNLNAELGYEVELSVDKTIGSLRVVTDAVEFNLTNSTLTLDSPEADISEPVLAIGAEPGATGALYVAGGNLELENNFAVVGDWDGSGTLEIGLSGEVVLEPETGVWMELARASTAEARVEIKDGGLLSTPIAFSALEPETAAAIYVTGDNSTWAGGDVTLAQQGETILEITSNGLATFETLLVGDEVSGDGEILVSGLDSNLQLGQDGSVTVGREGRGVIRVVNEAEFSSEAIASLAEESGSYGALLVSGGAGLFSEVIIVGSNGQGELLIEDSAAADIGTIEVGLYEGPGETILENRVTVSGESAFLLLGEQLDDVADVPSLVGRGGPAILEVLESAGLEASGDLIIGAEPVNPQQTAANSEGKFEVRGVGTIANIKGVFAVGDQNKGVVIVADGARLISPEAQLGISPSANNDTSLVLLSGEVGASFEADYISVGLGAPVALWSLENAAAKTNFLDVGPFGTVIGPVLTLGPPPLLKHVSLSDSVGIFADSLILRQGAVLDVEAVVVEEGAYVGGAEWPYDFTNSGTVNPGDSTGTTGVLTVAGDYVQSPNGLLDLELGSNANDALSVDGSATLSGTLRVTVLDDATVRADDRFEIISAASVVGEFSTVVTPPGMDIVLTYGPAGVVVDIATVVAIHDPSELPSELRLHQNYPNPFNSMTKIGYDVSHNGPVRLALFDVLGREVAVLVDRVQAPGQFELPLDPGVLPGGMYLYRIQSGGVTKTRSMILLE